MSIRRTFCAVHGAAFRLFGILAVALALQIPHFGAAFAGDMSEPATTAQAQMHAAMGHGDVKHKSMEPTLCALVCAGGVAAWQPPLDRPRETVTRVVWRGVVDLSAPLSDPDPARRPPRTTHIA